MQKRFFKGETAMTSSEYYRNLLPENERDFFPYMPTINELVSFALEHFAQEIALDGKAGPVTYLEMQDHIAGLRGFLRRQGIQAGDKVGIQLPNCAMAAELILAAMTFGAVIVPFPMTMDGDELANNLKKMDIRLFIYADMLEARVSAVQAPDGLAKLPLSQVAYSDPAPEGKTEKETPAAIFFTGGTTGRSKGAVLSHGALIDRKSVV